MVLFSLKYERVIFIEINSFCISETWFLEFYVWDFNHKRCLIIKLSVKIICSPRNNAYIWKTNLVNQFGFPRCCSLRLSMKTQRFFILSFKVLSFVRKVVEMHSTISEKLILEKNRIDISSLDNDVYLLRISAFEVNLIKSNYS